MEVQVSDAWMAVENVILQLSTIPYLHSLIGMATMALKLVFELILELMRTWTPPIVWL